MILYTVRNWNSICTGITNTDAIIPESDIVLLPLEANMDLLGRRDDLFEIADDGVTLCFRYANNSGDEAGVEEE